tara:strand:+ start:315 stop:518 length:204 start_codon:yes stop_codon:yes gene_type:complete
MQNLKINGYMDESQYKSGTSHDDSNPLFQMEILFMNLDKLDGLVEALKSAVPNDCVRISVSFDTYNY